MAMTDPFQSVTKRCAKCKWIKLYKSKQDIATLKKCRKKCAKCNRNGNTTYKFDIAFTLFNGFKGGTGKKEKSFERYSETVKSLINEGRSIREITRIMGKSINTIRKIRDRLLQEGKINRDNLKKNTK